jgi:hypothetical protein
MTRAFLFTVPPTLLFVLACSGITEEMTNRIAEEAVEQVVEASTPGGEQVEIDGGSLTVTGADGQKIQVGSGASLPDAWPADVPAYPGATITSSFAMPGTEPGRSAVNASFASTDPADKVIGFYKAQFSGWKSVMEAQTADGANHTWQAPDGKRVVNLITAADGSGTTIMLSVGDQ